jgi:branched-subunit amino acid ABC-type transport system permease component
MLRAVNTSTTVQFVHNGVALPAARVVVIAVPIIILTGLWWLVNRRGK